MDLTSVIYIAGYGRSGSTILDTLLGNHPQILGSGELTWLFELAHRGQACTCGGPLAGCDVWSQVISAVLQSSGISAEEAADITRNAERFAGRRAWHAAYRGLWENVFHQLRMQTGRCWIVDSSKNTRQTYHRMELLHAIPSLRIFVLHLVRDPRGVMWSMRRGSNRRLEAGQNARVPGGSARALLSWIVANRNVDRFRRRFPSADYLRVRYEDLVSSPRATLTAVGHFLGFDLGLIIGMLEQEAPLHAGHGISGNRTRRSGQLKLRADDQWRSHLPHWDRCLALLAAPWLRSYDYASIPCTTSPATSVNRKSRP